MVVHVIDASKLEAEQKYLFPFETVKFTGPIKAQGVQIVCPGEVIFNADLSKSGDNSAHIQCSQLKYRPVSKGSAFKLLAVIHHGLAVEIEPESAQKLILDDVECWKDQIRICLSKVSLDKLKLEFLNKEALSHHEIIPFETLDKIEATALQAPKGTKPFQRTKQHYPSHVIARDPFNFLCDTAEEVTEIPIENPSKYQQTDWVHVEPTEGSASESSREYTPARNQGGAAASVGGGDGSKPAAAHSNAPTPAEGAPSSGNTATGKGWWGLW